MESKKIGIATAEFSGLSKKSKYFSRLDCYTCEIVLSNSSALLPYLIIGKTLEEAEDFKNKIRKIFKESNIFTKDKFVVMFEQDKNSVLALGAIGKDFWIDVNDNFKIKNFNDLNINFASLKVY